MGVFRVTCVIRVVTRYSWDVIGFLKEDDFGGVIVSFDIRFEGVKFLAEAATVPLPDY